MAAEENFLRRWSQRKHDSTRQQPPAEPAPTRGGKPEPSAAAPAAVPTTAAVPAPQPKPQPTELPSVESLKGLASDYKEFLDPAIDEDLRRSALKKLFHDPHFNVMDGLDVYIDDYSKPDPIPESMLKDLLARHLEFPDPTQPPEERDGGTRLAEAPRADPELPAPESAAPVAPPPAAVSASEAPATTEPAKR